MRFFSYINNDEMDRLFYQKPQFFDKYTKRELLSHALGATLYMPASRKNIHKEILMRKHKGLTSLVIDLEDAVGDTEVDNAENNLVNELLKLYQEKCKELESSKDFPLIFIRIRHLEQFKRLKEQLGEALSLLTGVVLPKFSPETGFELLSEVSEISTNEHPFYAMPILESGKVIKKETRIDELVKIKELLDKYKGNILNIRIGATDFSGLYGIRRSSDTTVYEIAVLRDCISDIINVFLRADSPYVISGPVWEYFSSKDRILKPQLRQTPFWNSNGNEGLKWRGELIERNMDGLIREILMDIANGLTGKTIIHPSHIRVVQALNVVSFEEYMDALHIIEAATGENGVIKSLFSNKMNEIKPHYYWAKKIILKSQTYGVLHEEYTSIDLIKKEVFV
jgi:citrate lyase beta subunit